MLTLLVQAESRGLSAFDACAENPVRRFRVRAGPSPSNAAPSGAGRQARGTARGISPAPILGALRGAPARKG
ncbi:MAG: hypothetical protein AB7L36_11185, partial [Sphingomonadaceae bacterium]